MPINKSAPAQQVGSRSTLSFVAILLLVSSTAWPGEFFEAAKLTAEDGASNDFYGFSVALSADTALVGALRDDDKGIDSGSVYVLTRVEGNWCEQGKLTAIDGEEGDEFGGKVALDGDFAVIGARNDDDQGDSSGSAYVFARSESTWRQQVKLTVSDGAVGDEFGYSVAISGDTAVVGAPQDDGSGSVYVFTRSGSMWAQQAKLVAADGAEGDVFGISVAIAGDTLVVGADLADESGSNSGAAYVFTRSGNTWREQAKLGAHDGEAGDLFGIRVALFGETALIGAPRKDDNGEDVGAAYVFTRSGNEWRQQAKLGPTDGEPNDRFATRVAIHGDTAVIGAILDDAASENSGSAYVFKRAGGRWNQKAKLVASDPSVNAVFGWGVSLYGKTIAIGAPTSIISSPGGAGSAYLFEISPDKVRSGDEQPEGN